MRIETPPRLRGYINRVAWPARFELRDQPFASSIPMDIRRVDEVHATVDRTMQRRQRLRIVHIAPRPADRPGAEGDFRDIPPRAAERAIVHAPSPFRWQPSR